MNNSNNELNLSSNRNNKYFSSEKQKQMTFEQNQLNTLAFIYSINNESDLILENNRMLNQKSYNFKLIKNNQEISEFDIEKGANNTFMNFFGGVRNTTKNSTLDKKFLLNAYLIGELGIHTVYLKSDYRKNNSKNIFFIRIENIGGYFFNKYSIDFNTFSYNIRNLLEERLKKKKIEEKLTTNIRIELDVIKEIFNNSKSDSLTRDNQMIQQPNHELNNLPINNNQINSNQINNSIKNPINNINSNNRPININNPSININNPPININNRPFNPPVITNNRPFSNNPVIIMNNRIINPPFNSNNNQFNPQINPPFNQRLNQPFNPSINPQINPQFNPQFNQPFNPQINMNNPPFNVNNNRSNLDFSSGFFISYGNNEDNLEFYKIINDYRINGIKPFITHEKKNRTLGPKPPDNRMNRYTQLRPPSEIVQQSNYIHNQNNGRDKNTKYLVDSVRIDNSNNSPNISININSFNNKRNNQISNQNLGDNSKSLLYIPTQIIDDDSETLDDSATIDDNANLNGSATLDDSVTIDEREMKKDYKPNHELRK